MAYHKGNCFLTNVTADNLRTSWRSWEPNVIDPYASLVVNPLTHAKYFNTRNFAVVSLNLKINFSNATPIPYSTIAIRLPDTLQVRAGTFFRNQGIIERETNTAERKYSVCNITVDGETQGGIDGTTYLYLNRLFIQNLGQFIAGQTYEFKGQMTFEPSV